MFRLPSSARPDGSLAVDLGVRVESQPCTWAFGHHGENTGRASALRTSRR